MWNDIETTSDYLHFSVISRTVADVIEESGDNPISIGVSGSWGSGKSSMVKMIGKELLSRDNAHNKYIFLDFNAWLYQGYDDARSALLHSVSDTLSIKMKEQKIPETNGAWERLKNFTKRINWFQVSKLTLPLLAGLIPGVNAAGAIGVFISAIASSLSNKANVEENSENVNTALEKLTPELESIILNESDKTITEQVEELREDFKSLLESLNMKLIVLVDDLDRCLPDTAISTLEAMRLLLFVDRTAFIIAADDQMIRNGVKAHFGDVELSEGLVTSYFDKLIQVPIRVPHLGVAEIKVYIVLLYLEAALNQGKITERYLSEAKKKLNELLSQAWRQDVDKDAIMKVLGDGIDQTIIDAVSMAEQLASILVTAETIQGNPRLIKRFLNALEIRKKVAKFNDMTIDSGLLIKMLLFERCASVGAFEYLAKEVAKSEDGRPTFIKKIEEELLDGHEYEVSDSSWKSDFIKNWLLLSPKLGDVDLRQMLYLSRDKLVEFAAYDELSEEGKEILKALSIVKAGSTNEDLVSNMRKLGETESSILLNRLFRIGRNDQWKPDTLYAALHVVEAFPGLGSKLAREMAAIPVRSLLPAYIPLIYGKEWANGLISSWFENPETPTTVKNAINAKKSRK